MNHCKPIFSLIAVSCLGMASIAACSVKEERSVCPCYLEVEFEDGGSIINPVLLAGWNESQLFGVETVPADYPDGYVQKVSRTMLMFGAANGLKAGRLHGHTIMIPAGEECDSLYVFNDYVDCTGEAASARVRFHKQFATVNLVFGKSDTEGYAFVAEAGSCGIDMLTCGVVHGAFRCTPVPGDDGRQSFRIPRQDDDGLSLTIVSPAGDDYTFPIGEYIARTGYDWSATDLQDIYITLDFADGRISVGVADWEQVQDFDLTTVEL